MDDLHIDFETRSRVDLKKAGAHRYMEDTSTEVYCGAWAIGEMEPELWLPGEPCPTEIVEHINAGGTVCAFNAAFERLCFRHILGPVHGWPVPELRQYRCIMAQALAMALPGSLEDCGNALGIANKKNAEAHGLMVKYSKPRAVGPDGTITWWDRPEDLRIIWAYCRQDVRAERDIAKKTLKLRPFEQNLWFLDQQINDRGLLVDEALVQRALVVVDRTIASLNARMAAVTGGEVTAVSQVARLLKWVYARGVTDADGEPITSLAKDIIAGLLERSDLPPDVDEALELRAEGNKASAAKIKALAIGKCADGRIKGLLQYHKASTGRWAGSRFQPQNIKRPEKKGEISGAIDALLSTDPETFELLYDRPLSTVSDCIRGMVMAPSGKLIYARDWSNIEGRMLAWLAGEEWKLEAFRAYDRKEGPDLYKLTAGGILGKPVDAITDDERQAYGKVPELALGYQGGVGAFQSMARVYGVRVTDAKADEIKVGWREKNPNIRQFWYDLENAAFEAVNNPGRAVPCGRLLFKRVGSFLFLRLPSGRSLCYAQPELREKTMPWIDERTGKKAIKLSLSYMGVNSYSRRWERCWAYGGLLAENATSGASRDVMAEALVRLEARGYETILTVHDEVVCEVGSVAVAGSNWRGSPEEFQEIVEEVPSWCPGLPVAVAGFEAERYRK